MAEPTEYERGYDQGYSHGVAAASAKVASFFRDLKDKDAKILSEMSAGQEMMHKLMLNVLAPLQDEVRQLRPVKIVKV